MFQACENFVIYHEMKGEFNKFFSSFFSSTSLAIRMPKLVQLGNEVSTLFPKLHRIERACEFFLLIYHRSTKQIDFRLQTSLICKKKKKHVRRDC